MNDEPTDDERLGMAVLFVLRVVAVMLLAGVCVEAMYQ